MQSTMLTGATGFIGSHIAEKLLQREAPLHLFARRETHGLRSFKDRGAKIYLAPCHDIESLRASLRGVETVIHCAGATKALREEGFFEANVRFTHNILKLMSEKQRMVFISSQAAAGPSNSEPPIHEAAKPAPLTWYGKSKLAAETQVRDWGKQNRENFVILRPSAAYGPRDRDMLVYFKLIKKGLFIFPVDAENRFSLLHVTDLVGAVIRAAEDPARGETYFVSGDEACTWERLGTAIKRALNRAHPLKVALPPFTQHVGPYICDLISHIRGKPLFMSRQKMLELKQPAWLCSNKKIKERLQWAPQIPLEQGIKETARWYIKENWL